MNEQKFAEIIRGSLLAPHFDFIMSLIKPAIEISLLESEGESTSSRLGGLPFMPDNFEWPSHERGFYRFVCQINFTEVPEIKILPNNGLLSLFVAEDPEGDSWYWEDNYALGYFSTNLDNHVITSPPDKSAVGPSAAINFSKTIDLPFLSYLREDWPWTEDEHDEFEYGLGELMGRPYGYLDNYLLGYPPGSSLAYNPLPGPEWISILTLKSHERLDWCWHDGGPLMVFIEPTKLENGDFSKLKCEAG